MESRSEVDPREGISDFQITNDIIRENYPADRQDSSTGPDQIFAYVRKSYRISEIGAE